MDIGIITPPNKCPPKGLKIFLDMMANVVYTIIIRLKGVIYHEKNV